MIEVTKSFRYVGPTGHIRLQSPGVYDELPEYVHEAGKEAGAIKKRRAPRNKMRAAPRNK